MDGTIKLEGMEFFANHGCLESEKTDGNLFTVDFEGTYDFSDAAASDRLEDAVDYAGVYDAISQEMAVHSDLLEHLVARISDRIMHEFAPFKSIWVEVSKKNPPVSGPVEWSRASMKRTRE